MSYEILYTSAPSGLKPGSSGYCTVQGSRGIPAPAVDLLESLSGYRHVFTPGSPEATHNPVNWGHYLIRIAGRVEHVLSRVGDCELDYTGRSNKLAHHLVVDAPTTATLPGGPAWFLSRPGLMYNQWDGTVSHLGTPRIPPPERRTGGKCAAWGAATGDSGWGGVLAESFLADPERKVFVVYAPGTNVLALFEEAIALLPEHRRWDVTFATYGAALPKTVDCLWSGLIAGSPEVAQSHRFVNALRIDLTSRMGRAVGGPLVELARTGASTSPTRPTTRHASTVAQVAPSAEPVYEAGYQPVPPPPAILATSTTPLEDFPPSLPRRTKPSNAWKITTITLAIGVIGVGAAIATFVLTRNQPLKQQPDNTSQTAPTGSSLVEPPRETSPVAATETRQPDRKVLPANNADDAPILPELARQDPRSQSQPKVPTESPSDAARARPKEPKLPVDSQGHTRIFAMTRPLILGAKSAVQVKIPQFTDWQIKNVTHASLMVPQTKDAFNLYGVTRQTVVDKDLRLMPRMAGARDETLSLQWNITNGQLSLTITPRDDLPTSQKVTMEYGVLLLNEDSGGRHLFINFSRGISSVGTFAVKEPAIQIQYPRELQAFFQHALLRDVAIDELKLEFGDAKNAHEIRKVAERSWAIDEETDNLFKSVSIQSELDINEQNHVRMEYKFKPEMKSIEGEINNKLSILNGYWNSLKLSLGEETMSKTREAIRIGAKVDSLPTDLEMAASELKTTIHQLKMDKKIDDSVEMRLTGEVDKYKELLTKYRREKHVVDRVKSQLRIISGKCRCKVWPVEKVKRATAIADHPEKLEFDWIDLFEFEKAG